MKKISMFIVMLLTCLLSFGYPHPYFHPRPHPHHVYHHHKSSRPVMNYRKAQTPKPKPHYSRRYRYIKDPVTNRVILYFFLTRGTNSYQHEGREYERCKGCGKVFILRGQIFCKRCIKTRRYGVQQIRKK